VREEELKPPTGWPNRFRNGGKINYEDTRLFRPTYFCKEVRKGEGE